MINDLENGNKIDEIISTYDLIKYCKRTGSKINLKPVRRVLEKDRMWKEDPNKCIEDFINSNRLLKSIIENHNTFNIDSVIHWNVKKKSDDEKLFYVTDPCHCLDGWYRTYTVHDETIIERVDRLCELSSR